MDLNSSLGKICLGEDVVVISSDKVEGSGDWTSLEFQDTANSGQKNETKAMVFYQIETEEVSDRFVAPCFVNGLEAYDGEINLGVEENMISNEYAVKLYMEHEVKRGNKVVKKELIVALRGELYFVKFIINQEEDDVEPRVIFGRSFLRMTKAITDFSAGTITIYPDIDPFLEETEEEEKSNDDWDHLLDFNIDDIPLLGEEGLPPFVCKMGKSSRNKKRAMENLNFFYQDIGTSSSAGGHLTQEEAAKEALAIRMSRKFALLEEERPIIETMAYHDKYKKILDEVWKDKVELDGKIVKEEEEAVKRIKGEALKEKDDTRAFIFPIRLEGQVNENELADTGSDINTMPYWIYEQLGREDMKKVDRGITMINHTQAEAMGILTNVLCQVGVTTLIAKFLILDIPVDRDSPIVVGRGFLRMIGGIVNTSERLFLTFDGFCHQTFHAARSDVIRNAESDSDDEEEYPKTSRGLLFVHSIGDKVGKSLSRSN
ncbi:ribonuclease H-like domain-containing protein [Tanacetum coccineum]